MCFWHFPSTSYGPGSVQALGIRARLPGPFLFCSWPPQLQLSPSLPTPLPFARPGIPGSRQNLKRLPFKQTSWTGKPGADMSDLTLSTLPHEIIQIHIPVSGFSSVHLSPFSAGLGGLSTAPSILPFPTCPGVYFHLLGLCSTHLWNPHPPGRGVSCSAYGSRNWYSPYGAPFGNVYQNEKCVYLLAQ